ncbi:hypothetical protein L916_02732 [Phytophthora nicotianae]|uniref:Uncharacterized protein n=1 Tax=Phytophthora nicotianae TaxID=4792 RepID=W2JPH8_PHYNI|nr:hypothetical protein L916_02732 [Phytophthora nicotianae]
MMEKRNGRRLLGSFLVTVLLFGPPYTLNGMKRNAALTALTTKQTC